MQRRIAERMKRRIKRDGPYLSICRIRLLLNYPLPRDVCVLPATPYYYKGGPYLSITIREPGLLADVMLENLRPAKLPLFSIIRLLPRVDGSINARALVGLAEEVSIEMVQLQGGVG